MRGASQIALVVATVGIVACSRAKDAGKQKALENAKRDSERQQQAIQNTLDALRREAAAQSATPIPSATSQ